MKDTDRLITVTLLTQMSLCVYVCVCMCVCVCLCLYVCVCKRERQLDSWDKNFINLFKLLSRLEACSLNAVWAQITFSKGKEKNWTKQGSVFLQFWGKEHVVRLKLRQYCVILILSLIVKSEYSRTLYFIAFQVWAQT